MEMFSSEFIEKDSGIRLSKTCEVVKILCLVFTIGLTASSTDSTVSIMNLIFCDLLNFSLASL